MKNNELSYIPETCIQNGTYIIENKIWNMKRNCFAELQSLERIIIPENVKLIEDYAFANCRNLKEIQLIM